MKRAIMSFKKISYWLYQHIEGILMAVIAVLLLVDVLLGIVARYVQFEVVFATELGKYLFIWLSCVGISAAAKDNQHIRLDFFIKKLPISPHISWIVSQAVFICMTLIMCYLGWKLTQMQFTMGKSAMGFNYPMLFLPWLSRWGLPCVHSDW